MSKRAKQDSQDIGNAIEELNLHYFGFVYVKIHAKMGLLVSPDVVGLDDTVMIEGQETSLSRSYPSECFAVKRDIERLRKMKISQGEGDFYRIADSNIFTYCHGGHLAFSNVKLSSIEKFCNITVEEKHIKPSSTNTSSWVYLPYMYSNRALMHVYGDMLEVPSTSNHDEIKDAKESIEILKTLQTSANSYVGEFLLFPLCVL